MAEIAILGYGTIGSGVYEVFKTNQLSIDRKAAQPIRIKYILDLLDFPELPHIQRLITHDFNDILNDNDVSVVVEVMGGVEPAYTYVKKALLRGKSCVTSNKELVAAHGAELLEIARERNINFLFEASVGGGIPIIRPLNQSLTADEIQEIKGILNGTTNYILSKMAVEGADYNTVLKEAQQMGYAERNPDADVLGFDASRKIAILLSLAIGKQVEYTDIYTEGITGITQTDMLYAKKLGGSIRLIAAAKILNGSAFARVCPSIISEEHPLAVAKDVFNAIFVKGNVIGEVMFYGKGAGKLPTASAVVADIVDAVKHLTRNIMHFWSTEKISTASIDDISVKKLVRVSYENIQAAKLSITKAFGQVEFVELDGLTNEFAFITPEEKELNLKEKIQRLDVSEGIGRIISSIRFE